MVVPFLAASGSVLGSLSDASVTFVSLFSGLSFTVRFPFLLLNILKPIFKSERVCHGIIKLTSVLFVILYSTDSV